jgi:rhamnose utilization protein RhaD (predicted bifunctional aldolase and dehydrogenase)
MSLKQDCIEQQVKAFCAQIGADPLLVQGAGGNVSWKDGDTLWVKASGTWLADAEVKEIFVPVDYLFLQTALSRQDYSVQPKAINNSLLRPSIETLLHALMPHRVVVHLHAIEILAHLVQAEATKKIRRLVGDAVKWVYVDYFKPGADLARSVSAQLKTKLDADVVFLGNHGVVIGGANVEEVVATLRTLLSKTQLKIAQPIAEFGPTTRQSEFLAQGYIPVEDKEVGRFAKDNGLMRRVRCQWALYPDHVVFLGAQPAILDANFTSLDLTETANKKPPFIFSENDGVYQSLDVTAAQKSQLRCYYDVIVRQGESEVLSVLGDQQVFELLNWDAEKYRQNTHQ